MADTAILENGGGRRRSFPPFYDFRIEGHCEENMKEVWEGGEDAGNI